MHRFRPVQLQDLHPDVVLHHVRSGERVRVVDVAYQPIGLLVRAETVWLQRLKPNGDPVSARPQKKLPGAIVEQSEWWIDVTQSAEYGLRAVTADKLQEGVEVLHLPSGERNKIVRCSRAVPGHQVEVVWLQRLKPNGDPASTSPGRYAAHHLTDDPRWALRFSSEEST